MSAYKAAAGALRRLPRVPYTATRSRLWYERRGRGEPLLWISGFGFSSAVFEPVAELYTPRFDCIAYDNRGSWRSASPLRPTSIPELAGDAVALLDFLELESAHVYGLSMGGMIAQEVALRFPHRVRGLILGCTTAGGPRAALPSLGSLQSLAKPSPRALLDPIGGWLGSLLFSAEFRRTHPARTRRLLEYFLSHPPPPHGITAQWWAACFHDTGSRLHRIKAPTLVIHGELDAMVPPSNSRFLAARIPAAELAEIPGAGPAPHRSARAARAGHARSRAASWNRSHGRKPRGARATPDRELSTRVRAGDTTARDVS